MGGAVHPSQTACFSVAHFFTTRPTSCSLHIFVASQQHTCSPVHPSLAQDSFYQLRMRSPEEMKAKLK